MDYGVTHEYLVREYNKALAAQTTFYEQQPQLLRRTEAQALALARLHSLQALYTAFPDAVLVARKEDTSCTDTTLEYTAVYTLEADICTQNDPGS